jgi:hypothetical protein
MIAEDIGKALHDRATRGQPLSADDQAVLDAWYAQQDAEEGVLLAECPPLQDLEALRAEVDAARSLLGTVVQRIQMQAVENDRLRSENAELQRRLAEVLATGKREHSSGNAPAGT